MRLHSNKMYRPEIFGMNIKKLRQKRNLTMIQFAKEINIPRTCLMNYEKAITICDAFKALLIAEYFSVDLTEMLTNEHLTDE